MIEIGKSISLKLTEKLDKISQETEKFSSKVVDFFNQDLVIDYPISELTNKQSFFVDGTSFLASYIGKDTAVYQFETEIIGRKIVQIPVLILRSASPVEHKRIQRREYVRVKTAMEIVVSSSRSTMPAVTFDLSGGGCSFFIPIKEKIHPNEVVSLLLALNVGKGSPKYIETKAKVIRVNSFNTKKQLVSCEFSDLPVKTREQIIQFCFKRQLVQK